MTDSRRQTAAFVTKGTGELKRGFQPDIPAEARRYFTEGLKVVKVPDAAGFASKGPSRLGEAL